MKNFLVMMIIFGVLAGCGLLPRHSEEDSHVQGATMQWTLFPKNPEEQVGAPLVLRLSANGRKISESTCFPFQKPFEEAVLLPEGVNTFTAEVEGKVKVKFAALTRPNMHLDLLLYREDEAANASDNRYRLAYQVSDRNYVLSGDSAATKEGDLKKQWPLNVRFYQEGIGAAAESPADDLPLRICIDGQMVFCGLTRSGNMDPAEYIFSVKTGVHRLTVEIPGQRRREFIVGAFGQLWVSIHFSKRIPGMKIIVSNEEIFVF